MLLLLVAFCTPTHKHECDLNIEGDEGANVIVCYNICDRDFRDMSGRGEGKVGRTKVTSRSSRAGLQFPVGRIDRLLYTGNYAKCVGTGASIYLAAALEHLSAEVLESAGNSYSY